MIGSCRGSFQLTRLIIYGLPNVSKQDGILVRPRPSHPRYANCHGCRGHALKDVLDELITSLHSCAGRVVRYLLRNNSLEKLEQFGRTLDGVCDLRTNSRNKHTNPWGNYVGA